MGTVFSSALLLALSIMGLVSCTASTMDTFAYRIAYATYFGGSENEEAREVIVLGDGSAFIGGQTFSPDMPVTPGVLQDKYRGEPSGTGHSGVYGGDMFVVRLSTDASRIIASTYLGGTRQERNVYGMELDRAGNLVVMTATRSHDFTTTPGAFQEHYGGGAADFVVAKLSPDLRQLLWSTYIGASGEDWGRGGLTLDAEDNVYLVGGTDSPDFPAGTDAYHYGPGGGKDAVIIKLSADASRLLSTVQLGGSGDEGIMGVRLDEGGNIHVNGSTSSEDLPVTAGVPQAHLGGESDDFLAGFAPDGSQLLYLTYLGGSGAEYGEHRLALPGSGTAIVTGFTASRDFPTTPSAYQRHVRGSSDGSITRLSADRARWDFSTVLGGSGSEFFLQPTLNPDGNIFIVGLTKSRDFPVTKQAIQKSYGGGEGDAVLAVLSADGSQLLYATYLGGSGQELIRGVKLGAGGEVYLVGRTDSVDFPVTSGGVQPRPGGKYDAFFVKLEPLPINGVPGS